MKKYIIYTHLYEDSVGGVIVLHKLCSMLIEQGYDAKIWPAKKPTISDLATWKGWKRYRRWYFSILPKHYLGLLNIRSPYNLPVARSSDIRDAILVYPEVVSGNPLGAKNVVRWFLNKPGVLKKRVEYGSDDLFFYYDEQFNDWNRNPNQNHHLHVYELMKDVYKMINYAERHGSCYMVRKGKDRAHDQHAADAIKVDGLGHREMAEVFNRCKYFVTYDLYTMYARYAAMCGCIPVVIPEPGMTKEMWHPNIDNRYGLAYGWDDIPWAVETREKLLETHKEAEKLAMKSVANFAEITQQYFGKA